MVEAGGIFDGLGMGFLKVDKNSMVIIANRKADELFNQHMAFPLIGRELFGLPGIRFSSLFRLTYDRAMSSGKLVIFEETLPSMRKLKYHLSPHNKGVTIVVEDVTRDWLENESFLTAMFSLNSLSEAVFIVRESGNIVHANDAAYLVTGYQPHELISISISDVIPMLDRDKLKIVSDSPGQHVIFELEVRRKDGHVIPVEISVSLKKLYNALQFIVSAWDITERKRAEEELRSSESALKKAQEIARLGSWEWDLETNVVSGSEEMYRMLGLTPDPATFFQQYLDRLAPADQRRVQAALNAAVEDNVPYDIDYQVVLPDGSKRFIHAEAVTSYEHGKPVKVFGTVQDITERKRAEEALMAAKQQAELYLDLMGHDISNMHQIALGYLEVARDMNPEASQGEFLDKSVEVLQRSARLIQNVRKLQKLSDGLFRTQEVDVCRVLSDVRREYDAVHGKKVTLNLNGFEHCYVHANELLHDVFANLVSNAIKHTGDRADIVIGFAMVNDNDGQYYWVTVEDNGPGIPDDFKARIFDRVLKGTEKAKGMGLGLYLVRSFVDSYGGRVWVEDRVPSDSTKGARFVVLLPLVEK